MVKWNTFAVEKVLWLGGEGIGQGPRRPTSYRSMRSCRISQLEHNGKMQSIYATTQVMALTGYQNCRKTGSNPPPSQKKEMIAIYLGDSLGMQYINLLFLILPFMYMVLYRRVKRKVPVLKVHNLNRWFSTSVPQIVCRCAMEIGGVSLPPATQYAFNCQKMDVVSWQF